MFKKILLLFCFSFLFVPCVHAQTLKIDYTPDKIDATEKITMQLEVVTDQEIKISIYGNNFENSILGFAFNLNFDPKLLQYDYFRKGEFLEQGGDPIYLITTNEKNRGQLISGIILKRGDDLPKGSGKIVELFFKVLNSGQTKLFFDKTVASTLKEGERQDIKGIAWESGNLIINPSLIQNMNLMTNAFDLETALNSILVLIIVGCLVYTAYLANKIYQKRKGN